MINKTAVQLALHGHPSQGAAIMEEQDGYSGLFYFMLLIGIVGALGLLLVAAGSA